MGKVSLAALGGDEGTSRWWPASKTPERLGSSPPSAFSGAAVARGRPSRGPASIRPSRRRRASGAPALNAALADIRPGDGLCRAAGINGGVAESTRRVAHRREERRLSFSKVRHSLVARTFAPRRLPCRAGRLPPSLPPLPGPLHPTLFFRDAVCWPLA